MEDQIPAQSEDFPAQKQPTIAVPLKQTTKRVKPDEG